MCSRVVLIDSSRFSGRKRGEKAHNVVLGTAFVKVDGENEG